MGARSGEPVGGESGPVGGTGSANGWRCSSSRRTTACLLRTNGPHGTFCAAAHRPCDPGGTHGGRVRRGGVGRGEPAPPTRTGRRSAPAARGGRHRPSCPAVGARTYPGVLPGVPAPALAPDGPSKGPRSLSPAASPAVSPAVSSPGPLDGPAAGPTAPLAALLPAASSPTPACATSSRPPDGTSPSRARRGCGPSSPRRSRPTRVRALRSAAPAPRSSWSPPPSARPRSWPPPWASCSAPTRSPYLPSWETLPHERLSPRADTVGRRVAVLRRLAHPEAPDTPDVPLRVVVTATRSLIQPVVPGLGDLEPVRLAEGTEYELEALTARLVDLAYARVEMVEKRGEFAVRGGIVDLFPPTAAAPVRVEFWGDEVSELRCFSVADQRSLPGDGPDARPAEVVAPPCRELLLTDDGARPRRASSPPSTPRTRPSSELLSRVAEGIPSEGMESLIPALLSGEGRRPSSPCCPSCCPPAGTCWSATPSACSPAPPTSCAPGRSSSRPPGSRPRTERTGAPRSTSARRPTATSATCAPSRRRPGGRGGRCRASRPTRTSRTTPTPATGPACCGPGSPPSRPTAATSPAPPPTCGRSPPSGGIGVLVVPAAGTAQRAAEQLREHEVPVVLADEGLLGAPAGRRGHDHARVARRRRHGRRHAAGGRSPSPTSRAAARAATAS